MAVTGSAPSTSFRDAQADMDVAWKQAHNLAYALETRLRWGHRSYVMGGSWLGADPDDKLGDLENKALGLAQAIHEIRTLRRYMPAPRSGASEGDS